MKKVFANFVFSVENLRAFRSHQPNAIMNIIVFLKTICTQRQQTLAYNKTCVYPPTYKRVYQYIVYYSGKSATNQRMKNDS